MDVSLKNQSALLDAIYGAAIQPADYLEFAKIWDATILRLVESDQSSSIASQAELLELKKHFSRAYTVFEKSRLGQQQNIQKFLDDQAFPGALCKEDGVIIACNKAFTNQFSLSTGDNLSAISDRLQPLSVGGKQSDTKSLVAGDEAIAYRFHNDDAQSILVVESHERKIGQQKQFLVRSNYIRWSSRVEDFLTTSFGLTQTELEIAKLIFSGLRSEEIADHRGRKKGTVRQQIKSIMEKTETTTQVTLMALFVSLHHLFAAKPLQESNEEIHLSTAGLYHSTMLVEAPLWGKIEYEKYGDPNGTPVVFLHSQMSSAQPTQAMIKAMAKEKLFVLAPLKPGLGSTSIEQRETDPVGFVSAFLAYLSEHGIVPDILVGQGMSGVAAIEYAANNLEQVKSIITIDTGIPFTRREQFEDMPPVSKRIFWTVWDCPDLFYAPFAFASEALFAGKRGEETFMHDQFKDIPHDLALIQGTEFYGLALKSMKDFMSTPKRSADELVYWMHDWTGLLHKATQATKVVFLQSEHHDFLKYHEISEYLEAVYNSKAVLLSEVAQLCVLEKPELIAKHIASII